MSVTIGEKKLKFEVYGNGFENTRNDSGHGGTTNVRKVGYNSDSAIIDSSGEYFWHTQNSGMGTLTYIAKRRIDDLSSVSISPVPYSGGLLYHPSNVENNYGIAIQNQSSANCDIYIFDLTTNEIFYHFNTPRPSSFYMAKLVDCIMVGDDFYLALRGSGNAIIYKINIVNGTFIQNGSAWFNNGHGCGFVDNNTLYGYNNPVWFSDYGHRYGYGLGGGIQWDVVAPSAGGGGFPNTNERALCENGYIWLPTYIDGAWRWGKYDGNTGAGMTTPSPIKTIGNFGETNPKYDDFYLAYTHGHKRVVYVHASLGMIDTDFKEIDFVTDEYWKPLAMNDNYIIATNRNETQTGIFKYR